MENANENILKLRTLKARVAFVILIQLCLKVFHLKGTVVTIKPYFFCFLLTDFLRL